MWSVHVWGGARIRAKNMKFRAHAGQQVLGNTEEQAIPKTSNYSSPVAR